MTLKTFAASEVVTSDGMNLGTFQLPNSVLYGASQNGLVLSQTGETPVKQCEYLIDVALGRYLFIGFEKRIDPSGTGTAVVEARVMLPNGEHGLVIGSQIAVGTALTSFTETLVVLDLMANADGGDGAVDLRGAKLSVEFWTYLQVTGGNPACELKNIILMGGGGDSAADYGY